MSFENEVFKEPETVPMNEVHKNPETRANLPDDEDFDVDAEGTEEEIALSPETIRPSPPSGEYFEIIERAPGQ